MKLSYSVYFNFTKHIYKGYDKYTVQYILSWHHDHVKIGEVLSDR